MPFALKRNSDINPKVKVWRHHDPDGDGYVEIIKYKTREIAEAAAAKWGGGAWVEEVNWTAGENDDNYPNYDADYNPAQ